MCVCDSRSGDIGEGEGVAKRREREVKGFLGCPKSYLILIFADFSQDKKVILDIPS